MKGVILAAGDGTRLAPLTLTCPKVLIPLRGKPLIEYTIETLARVGVADLVIVVGHKASQVVAWLGDGRRYGVRIEYVFNPHFQRGNALSVYAAREVVGDAPFLLTMADHLIGPEIPAALLAQPRDRCALGVDRLAWTPAQLRDATKVWVDKKGQVTRIGKDIEPWNAVDTGVFLFTPVIFSAIAEVLRGGETGPDISRSIIRLIENGDGLRACDVSGAFWADVDTPEDLQEVEAIVPDSEVHFVTGFSAQGLERAS